MKCFKMIFSRVFDNYFFNHIWQAIITGRVNKHAWIVHLSSILSSWANAEFLCILVFFHVQIDILLLGGLSGLSPFQYIKHK